MFVKQKINPEHKRLLDKTRELYREVGGRFEEPEEAINISYKSRTGGVEIDFNYGTPQKMYTKEGAYRILGSPTYVGDNQKFWEVFNQAFAVEILVLQRDKKEYPTCHTGPYVRIKEG